MTSQNSNQELTLSEQIKAQPIGTAVMLDVSVAGQIRRVTIDRKNANRLLRGWELVVDPLDNAVTVRQ
jgi:hypothetical protein